MMSLALTFTAYTAIKAANKQNPCNCWRHEWGPSFIRTCTLLLDKSHCRHNSINTQYNVHWILCSRPQTWVCRPRRYYQAHFQGSNHSTLESNLRVDLPKCNRWFSLAMLLTQTVHVTNYILYFSLSIPRKHCVYRI